MYFVGLANDPGSLYRNLDTLGELAGHLCPADDSLIGVWCDRSTHQSPPRVLVFPCPRVGTRPVPVVQTFGLSGLWTLLRLEPGFLPEPTAGRSVHDVAIPALQGEVAATSSPRYLPVYRRNASAERVRSEVSALAARWPAIVGEPLYFSSAPGRFVRDYRTA